MFHPAQSFNLPQLDLNQVYKLKTKQISSNVNPNYYLPKQSNLQSKKAPSKTDYFSHVVNDISKDLSFEQDVVKTRCAHAVPYNEQDVFNLYRTRLLPRSPTRKIKTSSLKRDDPPQQNQYIDNLHNIDVHSDVSFPNRIRNDDLINTESADLKQYDCEQDTIASENYRNSSKPESASPREQNDESLNTLAEESWDEFVISELSDKTATWIVSQKTPAGNKKDKLRKILRSRSSHNYEAEASADLVVDDVAPVLAGSSRKTKENINWNVPFESILKEIKEQEECLSHQKEVQPEFTTFPASIKREKTFIETKDPVNQSALAIKVREAKSFDPSISVKDFINPRAGSKVFLTENLFEQEWLTGTKRIYDPSTTLITHETDNKFVKHMQEAAPKTPDSWYKPDKLDNNEALISLNKKRLGQQRWTQLPSTLNESVNVVKLDEASEVSDEVVSNLSARSLQSSILVNIAAQWRASCQLDQRYAEASADQLIRDMVDLQPQVRLTAVTTCMRAAERSSADKHDKYSQLLPEKLFTALHCLMSDTDERVRQAAAITLLVLQRPSDKALDLMRQALSEDSVGDAWTAAECLAYYNQCDSDVISPLIGQFIESCDSQLQQQALFLLTKLSQISSLVHSMISEHLNSHNWRHRVIACRLISDIGGQPSKDLISKFAWLMWSDSHSDVRTAAARCLGKLGHGKLVHDLLKGKLADPTEKIRIHAINLVATLGIMTVKLLPLFVKCFRDEYIAVRKAVCTACYTLAVKEPQLLAELLHLASFDHVCSVKILAFRALGKIGVVTDEIRQQVLWAFRFEENAKVRAEACRIIDRLNFTDQQVLQVLQDRHLVEPEEFVRREILICLRKFDIGPIEDMDMISRVRKEVRKLCTSKNVSEKICANEKQRKARRDRDRLIYTQPITETESAE